MISRYHENSYTLAVKIHDKISAWRGLALSRCCLVPNTISLDGLFSSRVECRRCARMAILGALLPRELNVPPVFFSCSVPSIASRDGLTDTETIVDEATAHPYNFNCLI